MSQVNLDVDQFMDELFEQIDFTEIETFVGDTFGWYCETETGDLLSVNASDLRQYQKAKKFACMECSCGTRPSSNDIQFGDMTLEQEVEALRKLVLEPMAQDEQIQRVLFEGFLNVKGLRALASGIVEPGYRTAQRWCQPFSKVWYLAEIAKQIAKLEEAEFEHERLRASMLIGRYLSEMHWRDQHWEDTLQGRRGKKNKLYQSKQTKKANTSRKNKRIELVLEQIEQLKEQVGEFSDEVIVDEAFKRATKIDPLVPKSKSSRDEYLTALVSESHWKSRYWAVFNKIA